MARLSKHDWLDHGLETLATEGAGGLKADRMVKSLGVSRGSFYWHFDDLAAFHSAVLEHWLEVTVLAVVAELEAQDGSPPKEKLRSLIEIASRGMGTLEQAIRAWGFSDEGVRSTIANVDQQRIEYVTGLMTEAGLAPKVAKARAHTVYMSSVGYSYLGDQLTPAIKAAALADIQAYALTDM